MDASSENECNERPGDRAEWRTSVVGCAGAERIGGFVALLNPYQHGVGQALGIGLFWPAAERGPGAFGSRHAQRDLAAFILDRRLDLQAVRGRVAGEFERGAPPFQTD